MEDKIKLIERICNSPVEIPEVEEYLVLPDELKLSEKIIKMIDFLREFNPVNEKKLETLFESVHEELILMKHFGIINVQKINENVEDNIITLNRKLRILS